MTITPELIKEVAEWVRAFDSNLDYEAAETLLQHADEMKVRLDAEFGPDAALASALRTAYHDDGEVYYAKFSSVPGQWLRMAAAARTQIDAERSEPRRATEIVPRKWAKAAEVPDGVRFEEYEKPGQGSWAREGSYYRYRMSDGFTTGGEWSESQVNSYAPLVEVLS